MKGPICAVCLKSGILCRACGEKVRRGEVSDTDIRVSRIVLRLSRTKRSLRDITLKQVVESDNLMVIICEQGDAANVIGRSGLVVKRLEKELDKPVRIVEESGDVKGFIANLLHPVPLLGMNILYRPEGEVIRALAGKGPGPRIPQRDFKQIVKFLYGKDIELIGK